MLNNLFRVGWKLRNGDKLNINGENLKMFWTTWGISMTFSGKMWLMIILSHRKPGLHLEDKFLEKPQRTGEGGSQVAP